MLDGRRDLIGVQQVFFQSAQHLALEHRVADLAAVAAGAGAARIGAAPDAIGHDHDRAAANAAADHARQQALWSAVIFLRHLRAGDQRRLQSLPLVGRDDLQTGHRCALPFLWRVRPRHTAAGVRIAHHVRSIVDQDAAVDFVAQDAVLPPGIAVDHRDGPQLAGRRRDTFGIEPARNDPRRIAFKIFGNDAADDLGLVGVDLTQAQFGFAARVELMHLAIAIGQIAGDPARGDSPALPAPDLVRHILAEERSHGALEAYLQFVDLAFGQAENAGTGVDDVIVQPAHIALMAREPIERLCQHLIGLACLDMVDQPIEAWAVAHGPRNGKVGEDRRYCPAFTLGALLADAHLILDRPSVLQLAAVARIDSCPHESLPPFRAHGRAVPRTRQAQW